MLCRTDPDAPKHKGITFLLCPMDQPGVEVRPIKMITGDSEFNEVFFTDARCPKENVVGEVNSGWGVAMTLLGYERGEAAATFPLKFRTELDRLDGGREGARPRRRSRHPPEAGVVPLEGRDHALPRHAHAHAIPRRQASRPDAAIFKLYWSEYHRIVTELGVDMFGADAWRRPARRWPNSSFQTDDPGAPNDSASFAGTFFNARGNDLRRHRARCSATSSAR